MTTRLALTVAALFLASASGARADDGATLYQGRSAGAWAEQLADEDAQRAHEAEQALRALGPAALEVLRAWRDEPDPRLRARLVTLRVELARDAEDLAQLMEQARRDEDPDVRKHASWACAHVREWVPTGPGATQPLLPSTPDARGAACLTSASERLSPSRAGSPPFDVAELSEDPPRHAGRTLEEWIDLYVDDPGASNEALAVLARFPSQAAAAWVRMVERGDAPMHADRGWIPHAPAAARSSAVRRGLRRLIDGRDCEVVDRAARALGSAGVAAADALPSLVAAARDDGLVGPDCDGRVAAIRAIAEIGVFDTQAELALIELLDHDDPAVSSAAAQGMAAFGPLATPHVPRLASLLAGAARDARELGEPDAGEHAEYWKTWRHVESLAEALEDLRMHARAAEPALVAALTAVGEPEDAEPFARALRATWGIDSLIERLRSEEAARRDVAFAVVPHLTNRRGHSAPSLENDSWPLVAVLCELLTGQDADLRRRAAAVVTAFPDTACHFAACLAPSLLSDGPEVADAARAALVAVTEEAILHSGPCVLEVLQEVEADARARPTVERIRTSLRRAREGKDLYELSLGIEGGAEIDWLLPRARDLAARCPQRLERALDRTVRITNDPAIHASAEALRTVFEEVGSHDGP